MNDTKSHFLIIEILLKDYKRKVYSQKEVKACFHGKILTSFL